MTRLQCGDRVLDLSQPQVMGVLNTTPDSFSDGGSYHHDGSLQLDSVLRQVESMVMAGAAIIDVGGESTRPGAEAVSLPEELERVVPVVAAISSRFDVVISVDTSTPEVMTEAAAEGAGLINDVRALQRRGAIEAAASTHLPVCLMHMQGSPKTMQLQPSYGEVIKDITEFLEDRIAAVEAGGISRERLLLDPGFGFGKRLDHNLALLKYLPKLSSLGLPLLVGLSRKSMFGQLLGREVDERLAASIAAALIAAQHGAKIIRVHDVRETVDVLKLWRAVEQAGEP